MSLQPGGTLGPYKIVAILGTGGMGEVWLATETDLERRVALKVLPAELTRDAARVNRFQQEARAASRLNHPNVCTIHALGRTLDGQHYIVMELVEGETLRSRLRTRAPTVREALDIASQVASALTAAHAVGIVHRDIKPENVMVRPDGYVKVLDFGLAKLVPNGPEHAGADATTTLARTDAGTVVGTVAYMSPEQARSLDVDPRTDVWALGCVLYEMVAGRAPFSGQSNSDVLAAILGRDPLPLARFEADAPLELQRIISKALKKDREHRYQTIRDLHLDVQQLRDELHTQAKSGSAGELASEDVSRGGRGSEHRHGSVVRGWIASRGRVMTLCAALAFAGLVSAWWWTTERFRLSSTALSGPVHRNLTRLTFGSGLQTDAAWSPDGRFLAYASDRKGNFDIWVQPVGGGDAVQVTRSAAHDTQPNWSPDGSTIVFRSERDGGGLFLVPALGGVERPLTSFGFSPSWSSEGDEVLFVNTSAFGETMSALRIYSVVPDQGAPPREIASDFLQGGSWSWMARHPDGRVSVMGHHRQFGDGLFTLARDGTQPVQSKESPDLPLRVYAGGGNVRRRFQWHPSGTALYIQTLFNGLYNLWKVRVNPGTLQWLSSERLTTGAGPDVSAALSPDGTRLAFTTEQGDTRVWLFPFEAGGRRIGPGRPVTEEGAIARSATLSRDGRSLAYNLSRPGIDREEVWVTDLVDGVSEQVGTDGLAPCWLGNDTLAYYYFRLDSQPETGRLAARMLGGRERYLSRWDTKHFFPTDWHTEHGLVGTYIVPEHDRMYIALWPTTNPDANVADKVLMSRSQTGFWQAKFSPNGRWLSFVTVRGDRPGGAEIAVAPADGSPPERWIRVAATHPQPDKPRWARDGRTLYFISRRPTSYYNLWAVPFDSDRGIPVGQPYAITNFDSPSRFISPDVGRSEMDVSADHVALTMKSVTGSIWMLDNVNR